MSQDITGNAEFIRLGPTLSSEQIADFVRGWDTATGVSFIFNYQLPLN